MECRVCNQQISFVRGNYPGRKRRATRAVHDSELPYALEQANGEVVMPHPGVQRKLRLELEHSHPRTQPASEMMQEMDTAEDLAEQPENSRVFSNVSV